MAYWAQWGRFRSDINQVFDHYSNFTIQWCHSEPNIVGIGSNSAIYSARLYPLSHGGSLERLLKWASGAELQTANSKDHRSLCRGHYTNAYDISYPYKQIYRPYYWFNRLSKLYVFIFFRPWLCLLIILGHWNVIAAPKYMIFHKFKGK